MAMTAEQAQARIEALEASLADVVRRLQTSETEHTRVHAELERTRTSGHGPSKSSFRLIDPKTMVPEKLGTKDGPSWRDWSDGTRAYVGMLDLKLAQAMKQVEGHESGLTPEMIREAGVDEQHAAQLSRYLRLRTEGHAMTIVKASQATQGPCPRAVAEAFVGARPERSGK